MTKILDWLTLNREVLLSGLGVSLLTLLAWAVRSRSTLQAYWPVPWIPLRYLRALRTDPYLNRWQDGAAILYAVHSSAAQAQSAPAPLKDILVEGIRTCDRLLVLGEPGCGKTATLEALTWDLATRGLRNATLTLAVSIAIIGLLSVFATPLALGLVLLMPLAYSWCQRVPFPVFIEMQTLEGKSLEEHVLKRLDQCAGGLWIAHRIRSLAAAGRIVLFMDGMNEVGRENHEFVARSWTELLGRGGHFSGCPVVLSSRQIGGSAAFLPNVKRVVVSDLTDEGVRQCLRFNHVKDVEAQFASLQELGMLREFGIGRNPYWLSAMIETNSYSPNRGAIFESHCRRRLYEEWQPGDPSVDDQMDFLSEVARLMGDADAVGSNMLRVNELAVRADRNKGAALERGQAAMLLRRQPLEKRIKFTHHLVQEFFTAYSLLTDQAAVLEHANDYTWWGTFIMFGGLLEDHTIDGVQRTGDKQRYLQFIRHLTLDAEGNQGALLAYGLLCTVANPDADLHTEVLGRILAGAERKAFRPEAVEALLRSAGDAVLRRFLDFLTQNPDVDAKRSLLWTLAQAKTQKVATIATTLLDDPDLAEQAADILASTGSIAVRPILLRLVTASQIQRSILIGLLKRIGAAAIPELTLELTDDRSCFHEASKEALAGMGAVAAERLIYMFRVESPTAKARIVETLIMMADDVVPALIGAVRKGEEAIQTNAIKALEGLGARVIPYIQENWKLIQTDAPLIRAAIVELLGKTRDPGAVELLLMAQHDEYDGVKIRAADALLEMDRPAYKAGQARDTRRRSRRVSALILLGAAQWLTLVLAWLSITIWYGGSVASELAAAFLFATIGEMSLFAMGGGRAREAGHTVRVLIGLLVGFVACAALGVVLPPGAFSTRNIVVATVVAFPLVLALRALFLQSMFEAYLPRKRVIVYGTGYAGEAIARLRRRWDRRGFEVVGYIVDGTAQVSDVFDKVIAKDATLFELCSISEADELVIAADHNRQSFPHSEVVECRFNEIDVVDVAAFLERETGRVRIDLWNPAWTIYSIGFRRSQLYDTASRMLDLVVSSLLILLTLPLMLTTMLAIKIEGGLRAPVLYGQGRVGLGGRTFTMWKFRSMRADIDRPGGAAWASKGDPRVTRVGAFIRRARIDELPQIWNVLHGEMSFVGPRPERTEFVADLSEKIPFYSERHCVRPGITGWSQLCYPYGSSEQDALEKLQYDLYFIKNRSVLFYLAILLQTAEIVVVGQGAR